MNDILNDDEPQLPAEKLAGMRSRVQNLNDKPTPVWQLGLGGLVLLAVLGGIGYALYEAYFDVKPEVEVEYYQGVRIAPGASQKDAQAAIAQFHASPEYAQAKERARKELEQEARAQQP